LILFANKSFKSKTRCLCLGSLLGVFANYCLSASFIIGVEDINYYPYFDFESANPSFSKDLFEQFAADSGHQISFLPLPIKQFNKWLFEENIDFKFPDNQRWQQQPVSPEHSLHFSDDILMMTAGTLVMSENKDKPESFIKNVGTIAGFQPTLWMEQIAQGKVKIIEDRSPKILVKQLVHGIVDGLDIDLAVANYHLHELQLNNKIVISSNIIRQVFAYKLSTLKYPQVIEQFNRWLLNNEEFVTALKARYGILDVEPNLKNINQ
jgi:polar amino acid transport system substrate-binding protein